MLPMVKVIFVEYKTIKPERFSDNNSYAQIIKNLIEVHQTESWIESNKPHLNVPKFKILDLLFSDVVAGIIFNHIILIVIIGIKTKSGK
jgi:hypothetical protein